MPTPSQSFQCLGEDAARGCNVETHETLATLAEHLSVVEGKMSLLYKEINELLVVETEGATVEPYEEGGLWAPWLYLWNILAAVVNDIVDVALDVLQHFLAPLFAFGRESRKGGNGREDMRLIEFVGLKPCVETASHGVVGHNGIGTDNAGDVECLGWRTKGDAALCCLLTDRGKGSVAVAE